MKQTAVKKLIKKDWIKRMNCLKRDCLFMNQYKEKKVNNEEGC